MADDREREIYLFCVIVKSSCDRVKRSPAVFENVCAHELGSSKCV